MAKAVKANDRSAPPTPAAADIVYCPAPATHSLACALAHATIAPAVQAQALGERRERRGEAPAYAIAIEKRLSQRIRECQQLIDRDAADQDERHENGQHHQRAGDERAQRGTAGPPDQPMMKGIARNREHRRPGDDAKERAQDQQHR